MNKISVNLKNKDHRLSQEKYNTSSLENRDYLCDVDANNTIENQVQEVIEQEAWKLIKKENVDILKEKEKD